MIKFVCSCGKHLKAKDAMASQRAVCPRCGSLVGIPALNAHHAGAAAPMSPQERLRHKRDQKPVPIDKAKVLESETSPKAPLRPVDGRLVRLLSAEALRHPDLKGRHLEQRWHEFAVYPFRAFRLCLGLALLMTVLSVIVALAGPHFLAAPPSEPWMRAAFYLACFVGLLFLVGVACAYLDCVLVSAAEGEIYYIKWSGKPLLTVFLAGGKWLLCFVTGPIVFAVMAWTYWLNCGDPRGIDWLILGELGIVTVAYQFYALVAVADRGRLRDLNPLTVADVAHRLGWRGLVVVVGAAAMLLPYGVMLLAGLAEVHRGTLKGWLLLVGAWMSGVLWGTFFCRVLGVWCFRSRVAAVEEEAEDEDEAEE